MRQFPEGRGDDKWVEPEGATHLSRFVRHVNDRFLADIAGELVQMHGVDNCIVVTTDRNTREDFDRPEMQRLGIRGKTIEQGLTLANQQCDT